MLPHSYKELFSYLLWRGHFWHPIWIFCHILDIASPLAIFAKIAIFAKFASLQGGTFGIQFKSPEADNFLPFSLLHAFLTIFAKIANFATIAIFAKIASFEGATFGIQFKSPEAGDFSPVSPFSPLHAFLDISELFWWIKRTMKVLGLSMCWENA